MTSIQPPPHDLGQIDQPSTNNDTDAVHHVLNYEALAISEKRVALEKLAMRYRPKVAPLDVKLRSLEYKRVELATEKKKLDQRLDELGGYTMKISTRLKFALYAALTLLCLTEMGGFYTTFSHLFGLHDYLSLPVAFGFAIGTATLAKFFGLMLAATFDTPDADPKQPSSQVKEQRNDQ